MLSMNKFWLKNTFYKLINSLKLFWVALTHPEPLSADMFMNMLKMHEFAITVASEKSPRVTHLYMNKQRIVSFWMYPGLSKNPTDRIAELLEEIESLKEVIERKE
jgi:hypothetical protein